MGDEAPDETAPDGGTTGGQGGLVVGVDGSQPAGEALDWAVRESRLRRVPLTVVHAWVQTWSDPARHLYAHNPAHGHVAPPDDLGATPPSASVGTDAASDEFSQKLAFVRSLVDDAVARDADAADGGPARPEITARQVHGWPAPALQQVADEVDAAMVVVGRSGTGRLGRLLLGSVSNAVVQDATRPVTVVGSRRDAAAASHPDGASTDPVADGPEQPADDRPRVVVGVDGSAHSVVALRAGADAARRIGGVLHAVTCWQISSTVAPADSFGWVPPVDDFARWAGERLQQTLVEAALELPADSVRTDVRHATPVVGLVAACAGADRVVIGTRGLGGLERLVLGSVSRQLLEAAPCPVTVVRA